MKLPTTLRARASRAGLTLVEMLIGTSILAVLGLTIATSTATMRDMTFSSSTQDQLQQQARRAMSVISADLRRAAAANFDVGGGELEYPVVFRPGDLDGAYLAEEHDFDAAPKLAEDGEGDMGDDEGILFCIPADDDADGSPDFDLATGELGWDLDGRISYSRQLGADGRTSIVRTVDGGDQRVVARDVELLEFDLHSVETPEVPLDSVRVRIAFRATSSGGDVYRHRAEFLVRMRSNG